MKLAPKHFIFVLNLVLVVALTGFRSGDKALWLSDYESAITASKESGKPVLMVFSGSDWCRPCIRLRKTVLEPQVFQEFAEDNLILLEVDFPRSRKNRLTKKQLQHNETLAERYNPAGLFPLILLLNSNEELIGKTDHATGSESLIAQLESWMKDKK